MATQLNDDFFDDFSIRKVLANGKVCIVLAAVLAMHTFGLYWCCCAAICLAFFLLGCGLRFFFYVWNVRCPILLEEFRNVDYYIEKTSIIPKLKHVTSDRCSRLPCSESLEKLLNEILDFTVRDFVLSWYANLTSDESFAKCVRCLLSRAAKMLILNLKKVNWVALLTHDFIDDFATHMRLFRKAKQKYQKSLEAGGSAAPALLEQYFFEMEFELEKKFCRKVLSTSKKGESEYLRSLADILNYLLVPPKDLTPRIFRLILRDIVAGQVLGVCVDMLCDPDYICSTVVYQLSSVPLKYEDFTTILEATDDPEELNVVMEHLQHEIQLQRSKDTGGADDEAIKQQLSSLYYLEKLINNRLSRIQRSDSTDSGGDEWQECVDMYDLSLAFVLCNHVALCSFMDYLSRTDGKSYIDMYLTVEGFKNSFLRVPFPKNGSDAKTIDPLVISSAKEVATEIYNRYFGSNSIHLVDIDEGIKKRLQAAIKSKVHPSMWFDEAQRRAFEILENDLRFYPSFKRSYAYVKLLSELKLLPVHENAGEKPSDGDVPLSETSQSYVGDSDLDSVGAVSYETTIKTIGMGNDQSNIFAVYNIEVKKFNHQRECMKHWVVTRRYSDFYSLNSLIKRKFPELGRISFPAKKTFNNMQHGFLENRKRALNTYLRTLLDPALLKRCKGLEDMLKDFLCQTNYNNDAGSFANKLTTTVVDPIRSGVKFVGNAVISMPDTLIDGVCRVGDGLGKVTRSVFRIQESALHDEDQCDRVAASLSYESADSIPLRILMLLMDEIFGLREKNQWIRRRMVAFLQQLIHATYGSSLNRKIIQYVRWLTSEEQVTSYVRQFRNSVWPNSVLAPSASPRSAAAKARTRVVARTLTLSLLPDEFKLFIGNETSLAGICLVFEALQYENLNRRLCHVILERLMVSTFPGRNLEQVISFLLQKQSKS